jgi:hypothetical protein
MVRRRNTQTKNRLSSKKGSRRGTKTIQQVSPSILSMMKQIPSENLDDETKLAKRHLTKEMWHLVSIAVKRMADELVSISNNQQATTRIGNQELQTTLKEANNVPVPSTIQLPIGTNTGSGDEPCIQENSTVVKESIKRHTSPLQMLEPPSHMKKKGVSNNATRRSIKSKIQNKSSKSRKASKQRLHNNYKLK